MSEKKSHPNTIFEPPGLILKLLSAFFMDVLPNREQDSVIKSLVVSMELKV